MGVAMFPPCCLTWGQTMVEVMKIMVTSFKRFHARTATLSAPDPAAGHCWPMPLLETPGHSQANLCQSLVGSPLLSPGSWCATGSVCALQESVYPVLCKFWKLCSGVNSDLLQKGLCHTQVCCIQTVSITCLLYGLIYINVYGPLLCFSFCFAFFFHNKATACLKGKWESSLLSRRKNMQKLLKWQFFQLLHPSWYLK